MTFEGPDGASCTTNNSTFEESDGASCHSNVATEESSTDVTSIIIDAKEQDIPYDMIIGRNSIIEHSLLLYDPEFHALGMRLRHKNDSLHDIAHNSAVGRVSPTVRGDTNEGKTKER